MSEEKKDRKPLLSHFQIALPENITPENFAARVSGTGPTSTSTGGAGGFPPPDTGADVDIDF